ncbi:alpha-glycosyltransferase-like protein [Candidatus Scalindua japonica]|uniref:Alpha-glycosyltransferase-like protein n=2 Tax=Candidatus Scalindua japonica TaxID=1284222 RepID=A0A286U4D2_9BACT|nr:alpha-glycosyltransferase-like protein [Candidatus Scalindua japonica]
MSKKDDLPEVGVVAKEHGIQVVPVFQTVKFDWWSLRRLINKYNIDIIHCHGYKPSVLGFLAEGRNGKRIIITCHLWTNETFRLKLYAFLESFVMRRVSVLITVSETIKTVLLKTGMRRDDIVVIHNGIDLEKWHELHNFNKLLYRETIGLKKDSIIISLFGRLNLQKGHKFLLEAIAGLSINNIEVMCIGDGPLRQELEVLSRKLNINNSVHFLGFRNDIEELLEITDICVLPSLDEGLPMILLEAMAMKKSVVATSVGAVPSVIINKKNGLLVPPGDVSLLKEAIQTVIKDPGLCSLIGNNARETVVNRYSSERMTEQYLEQYKKIAKI